MHLSKHLAKNIYLLFLINLSGATNDKVERKAIVDAGCVRPSLLMVQGIDSLEVHSDTHLDDSSSSSCDDNMDVDALNEELSLFCENFLEKYKHLKKKSFKLKEKMRNYFQN